MKLKKCILLASVFAFLISTLAGCSGKKSENVLFAEEKILAIGTVGLESEQVILDAEAAYNQLTEKEKSWFHGRTDSYARLLSGKAGRLLLSRNTLC